MASLSAQLLQLSDVLTEAGHPWEIIVVDRGQHPDARGFFDFWRDVPGFRVLAMDPRASNDEAVRRGMRAARGDAVILLNGNADRQIDLIGQAIARWEAGDDVIYAAHFSDSPGAELKSIDKAVLDGFVSDIGMVAAVSGISDFALLDGATLVGALR